MSQVTAEKNKLNGTRIVRQHYANVSLGNIEHDREILSPEVVHESLVAGNIRGIAGFINNIGRFKQSFPDLRFDIRTIVENGETVMVEAVFLGTNTGPMVGPKGTAPPTGRTVKLPFVDVWTVRNGKILENRIYYDQLGFMSQLGLMTSSST